MSDRTPAEKLAFALFVGTGVTVLPSDIDAALAAAGFRVVPIPDDNTRADAEAIVWALTCLPVQSRVLGPMTRQRAADLLAAAYLDGQPPDRPDRCPTPRGPEDWARAWLVPVPGGAYPVIDGRRCTLDEHRQFRDAWSALYDVWLVCCWMARVPPQVERQIVTAREASLLAHAGPDAVAPDLARKWHVGGSGDTR